MRMLDLTTTSFIAEEDLRINLPLWRKYDRDVTGSYWSRLTNYMLKHGYGGVMGRACWYLVRKQHNHQGRVITVNVLERADYSPYPRVIE